MYALKKWKFHIILLGFFIASRPTVLLAVEMRKLNVFHSRIEDHRFSRKTELYILKLIGRVIKEHVFQQNRKLYKYARIILNFEFLIMKMIEIEKLFDDN